MRARLTALEATVARLQDQLAAARKDSTTSSKPPSSDIVKPPAPPSAPATRPQGGQPGHPQHERDLLPGDQVQEFFDHRPPACCPDCGHALRPTGFPPRCVQQLDLGAVPVAVHEHRRHEAFCPACNKVHYGVLPTGVERGGLFGPRLTTVVAYLKGVCHASYSTVRKFLRDVVGVTVSRGYLAKVIAKVSAALARPYQELLDELPRQDVLNVDETSHRDRGVLLWTWCFRAELYTVYKIDPTRSADVLIEVLGAEFEGVLGCDCFSAYRRYMREFDVRLQFCLAHLVREVKFLTTLSDPAARRYGERFRDALRQLFLAFHQRGTVSEALWQSRLAAARAAVVRGATADVPPHAAARRLAARLEKYGASYFRFLTTPGVEPTNNLAEQAIRFVVIDRHITQGTRGEMGQRWSERIWTVLATCAQQGESVFAYLESAVTAWFTGDAAPSLLPDG